MSDEPAAVDKPSEKPAEPPKAAPPAVDPAKSYVGEQWKHSSPLISCRIDPHGRYVFAGAQDNNVVRFELANGKIALLAGHESWVRAIAFHAASDTVVTGDYAGRLIWRSIAAEAPAPLRTVEAHTGWIRAAAVGPDGVTLATCGNDGLVKLWNAADGAPLGDLIGHTCHVYNLAFHPGGKELVSIDLKGTLRHWDLTTGEELRQLAAADLWKYDAGFQADIGGARGLEFSADGKWLAASGITNVSNAFAGIGNPAIVLFDWQTGEKKQLWKPKEALNATTWGLNFHPAGFTLGVSGGNAGGLLLCYKPEAAEPFFQLNLPNTARDMHLHPDGLRVAVAHHDGHARICHLHAKA